MRILITGSNGLLGQKIVKICLKRGTEFLATSNGKNRNQDCPTDKYQEMDITNQKSSQDFGCMKQDQPLSRWW